MREAMNEVRVLLRARTQCIWINTYEEAEALKDLKELLPTTLPNHGLRVWTQTSGVVGVSLKSKELDRSMEDLEMFKGVCKMIQQDIDEHAPLQAYVFLDLSNIITDSDTRRAIRDLKENPGRSYIPFIVIAPTTNIPTDISKLFRVVDYGLPRFDEIHDMVSTANALLIKKAKEDPNGGYHPITKDEVKEVCRASYGLTVKEIDMILRESMVRDKTIDIDYVVKQKVEAVKKSGALDYKMPKIKLADIGGNEAIKQWLYEQKAAFSPEAREFGLPVPKGYISVGIPGCGKTMFAEAFAGEMAWPLLELNMSKVMDSLVGESEKRIEYALDVAKASAPCVLLLDEVEKMLGGSLL